MAHVLVAVSPRLGRLYEMTATRVNNSDWLLRVCG